MNWKLFWSASLAAVALPSFLLGSIGTRCRAEGIADALAIAVSVVTGIVVGESIFLVFNAATKRSWEFVRVASAFVSGPVAAVAGGSIGLVAVCPLFDWLVYGPHPSLYTGDTVYLGTAVVCALTAGAAGLVFGTGLGQHTGETAPRPPA